MSMKITPSNSANPNVNTNSVEKNSFWTKIKRAISVFRFKYLEEEINSYGYKISIFTVFQIFFIMAIVCIILGFAFGLHPFPMFLMVLCGFIFVPKLIINSFHQKFEQRRFDDANTYVEQMLYSFNQRKVISSSLVDVQSEFKDSSMRKVLAKAIETIDKENDVEKGLDIIYKAYPCSKIRTLHKFMLSAESVGGDFKRTIDLLNQDRAAWKKRKDKKILLKKRLKTIVVGSIAATLAICALFLHQLPSNLTIIDNGVIQGSTIIVWLIDLIFFVRADSINAKGILEEKDSFNNKDSKRRYKRVVTYDPKLEVKTSIKLAIVPVILMIIAFIRHKNGLGCAFILLSLFMIYQHRIGFNLTKKQATKEIQATFPQWMIDVALLVQTHSVKSALYHSIPNAPLILQDELAIFYNRINEEPHSVEPYIDFMKDFDVPQITSAMKMLYSVAEGEGGDPDEQISEIIRQNNNMLDIAEEIADEDSLSSLIALKMAPALAGSAKLLIDMFVFLIASMANAA